MRSCDPEHHDGLYWKSEQSLVGCRSAAVAPNANKPPLSVMCPARPTPPLPLPGEGSDRPGCLKGTAWSRPQLLQSQSQVQRQQGRQHDHPVHSPVGSAGQRHQHFLHACPVMFLPSQPEASARSLCWKEKISLFSILVYPPNAYHGQRTSECWPYRNRRDIKLFQHIGSASCLVGRYCWLIHPLMLSFLDVSAGAFPNVCSVCAASGTATTSPSWSR